MISRLLSIQSKMWFLGCISFISFFCPLQSHGNKVLNIYTWGNGIPRTVIRDFENKTGIKVNLSNYDSNETMFAKLKASSTPVYDVISPSSYYVERMQRLNMLTRLDKTRLPFRENIAPAFKNNSYDPHNTYSIPLIWGLTGIFYNQARVKNPPHSWKEFWQPQWRNQLMLIDDPREVFSIALLSLGFSPNDTNPQHIRMAYEKLLQLIPNIRLFAGDGMKTLMIDEDAVLGSAWNGDVFKASLENPDVRFIYPKDGFVIWVDTLAIPVNAPHLEEAYTFINYMLQAEPASQIALKEGHALTNSAAIQLLPPSTQKNLTIYPDKEILSHGIFQSDVGETTLSLYNDYWQRFKLAF